MVRFLGRAVSLMLGGLVLSAGVSLGQTATVRGFVSDAANGEVLPAVNVVAEGPAGVRAGAATNADGFYALAGLAPGRYVLRASFVGYAPALDTLVLARDEIRRLDLALVPRTEELDEVVVDVTRETSAAAVTAGLQRIRPADIERVPSVGPSKDFAAYLATLPGVVTVGDQGGRFFIRGGEPSQNLVLLDGMLIYQPFHVLNFFSAFPADVINSVDLYAGGFPARYGGRLSSVIDVQSRNGNNRAAAWRATLSPFVTGLRLEGPANSRGTLSLLASARHAVIEQGAARLVAQDVPFAFNDVFAKVHGVIRRNSRLSLSALHTYDRGTVGQDVGLTPLQEVRWRNDAVGGRYLFLPGSLPVLLEVLVSGSQLRTELGTAGDPVRTATVGRLNGAFHASHYGGYADVEWGMFARTLKLDSELGGLFQNVVTAREFVTETGAYFGPRLRLGPRLEVAPSLRLHHFPSKSQTFLEPRLRAVLDGDRRQLALALGRYHQEIIGLSDRRDATSVFTAWAAVPDREPVPEAWHAIASYRLRPAAGLELVAEGYFKWLRNLSIAEWTAFPRLTTRQQPADGRVVGFDLRAELRRRHFYGYLTYGLASVRYTAQQEQLELWFGTARYRFRPAHDRRHQINALASTRALGISLTARWQFGSGLPFNRALGFDGFVLMDRAVDPFREEGSRRVIYERPFNGLLPTYHRLDLEAERAVDVGRFRLTLQASVLNVYDRRNIFYLDVFTLQRADQLPLIPSFGLTLESLAR